MADDFSADITTAGGFLAGGPGTSGRIDTAGDIDWFRVYLFAGTTYRLRVRGTSSGAGTLADPALRLYDASGTAISGGFADGGGTGTDAQLTWTVATAGTYFVAASSSVAGGTGTYMVDAVIQDDLGDTAESAGTLAVRDTLAGTIDYPGDHDWIGLSLVAGVTYGIAVQGASSGSGTLAIPIVSLQDRSGLVAGGPIAGGGTGNDVLFSFTAGFTGTYYLDVAATAFADTGTYRVSLSYVDDVADGRPGAPPLAVGSDRTAAISYPGDHDYFAVDLRAGLRYRFDVQGAGTRQGTLSYALMQIVDSSGTVVPGSYVGWGTGFNTNTRLFFTPTTDGTYYVDVASFDYAYAGYLGSYRVGVAAVPAEVPRDFYGDGFSGALFRNAGSGGLTTWTFENGSPVVLRSLATVRTDATFGGTGRLFGDGRASPVFLNPTGTVMVPRSGPEGYNYGLYTVGTAPAGTSIAGIGDFDGDGTDDILFARADGTLLQWRMHNATQSATTTVGHADAGWQVAAVADITGDGVDDIIFQGPGGAVAAWEVHGGQATRGFGLGTTSSYWTLFAAADIDGDRQSDLLFKGMGGEIADWRIVGGAVAGTGTIGTMEAGWSMVSTGDFDGDGTSDLLFRSSGNALATWLIRDGHVDKVVNAGATTPDWVSL